jgi:3-methylfumaryl-CoA hydratase
MVSVDQYQAWVGRTEDSEDWVTPTAVRSVKAMFDAADLTTREGDTLPACWHWFFNNQVAAQSQIGPDGHPRRGGFLPPVELPRRMWAGSKLEFRSPIKVGDRLQRHSEILSVQGKSGSTGQLVFVTVRHTHRGAQGGETIDEQRIVYREAPPAGSNPLPARAEPAPADGEFVRHCSPDPVQLFRFSALTFNGHRIHYDHPYVTAVEGYPGLVVHGPLIALEMLNALQAAQPDLVLRSFDFTPKRPITVPMTMHAHGKRDGDGWSLWMETDGALASVGRVTA